MFEPPLNRTFRFGHMPQSFEPQTFYDASDCASEMPAELKIIPGTPLSLNSPFPSGCSSPYSMYAVENCAEMERFPQYPSRSVSDPMFFRTISEEPFQSPKPIRYS